jgi:hypothetical protein
MDVKKYKPRITIPTKRVTIRFGDTPQKLAQRCTGDANRWREIVKCNLGMQVWSKDKKSTLRPWNQGMCIQVPEDWNISEGG